MFRQTLIATALAGVLSSAGALAAADRGSDTWTEASITTAYTLSEQLNPFAIDVEVTSGTAHLRGEVESQVEKDLAEQIALGVDGVKQVRNDLQVAGNAPRKAAGSGFARTVEDASITARVKSQLLWNESTSALEIGVDTVQGTVNLEGTVASEAERQLVRRIALNTDGVRGVNDNLAVNAKSRDDTADNPSPVEAVKDLGKGVSDAWVTTKVKSALLYNGAVDGTAISVRTENGIVTLTGRVWDEYERTQATVIARGIIGVKGVQNQLRLPASS